MKRVRWTLLHLLAVFAAAAGNVPSSLGQVGESAIDVNEHLLQARPAALESSVSKSRERGRHAAGMGLVPLNTLGAGAYQGFTGGLYADGRNAPQGPYAEALRKAAAAIRPLDRSGKPERAGKIVVAGLGASVCRQIFEALAESGPAAEGKRSEVVFVNCAKGGHDVNKISDPARRYWESAKAAVEKAGFSPAQVQVAWYQSDDLLDTRDDFPGRPQRLQDGIARNMREAKECFSNLRICYHSARHTTAFMPDTAAKKKHGEPRPYHVGWAVKWLIEEQAAGKADLKFEGQEAVAPLVAWATYFWTDGDQPRPDGYHWTVADVGKDGIHLSAAGRTRVARELLDFWRTDAFARTWFTAGDPDIVDPADPLGAFEGRKGGRLVAVDKQTGQILRRHDVPSPPIFPGIAAARGTFYLTMQDGQIACFRK